jgi:internalin A
MTQDKTYHEAEERIEEARRDGTRGLDLSGLQLTALPASLGRLKRLQWLRLDSNQLTMLPAWLGQFTQLQDLRVNNNELAALPASLCHLTLLQILDLGNNKLAAPPEWLGQLTQLRRLCINNNQVTVLPTSLGQLTQLQEVRLDNNQLTTLPEWLGQLTQLQTLYLNDNQLAALPESLGQLMQLQTLYLNDNQLVALPKSLGQLTQLQRLDLDNNQLTALPASLGQLIQLECLRLDNNQLTELPQELAQLSELTGLFLHGNPALGLPPEFLGPDWEVVMDRNVKPGAPQSILDYYFRTRMEPTRRLNEAKMLIVGQGGVGKTSLVHYLTKNERCDQKELPTEGINIADWPVNGRKVVGNRLEQVNVHIWDFGGQEIMHATHQFFLTRRSLYLLVIDARSGEQESNLHYWLKIIGSYGGDAPVLVVINKCDQHPHELNETALKRDYPNLQGFVQTSCATGRGIAELRCKIEEQIHRLPNVFDELPLSYFQVKEELAQAAAEKNYVPIGEYQDICNRLKVNRQEDQAQLIRFLHDLGVVLNFQDPDDPYCLNDPFVLNPEWVTEGVYAIVNDKGLKAQKDGVLTHEKLTALLNALPGYPEEHHHFIVRKMIQFELAYDLGGPKGSGPRWLIPELLDPNEPPSMQWQQDESLNFQYAYPVLPAGVICRFIVRMHHHVQREKSWRSGTVLEIDGNRLLVRGDIKKNKVFIAVQGDKKPRREHLAIVRDAFRYIHSTIPELKPKEEVPLPDKPEIAVSYDHLLKLEERGRQEFDPEGADRAYEVKDLLNGVDSALYRQRRRQNKAKERERTGKKHVFVSYCHDNREEVLRLVEELEDAGEPVWWDEDILGGHDWKEAIRAAMENAYAVVLCLSPELTEDRYRSGVYPEIRDAIKIFRQYGPGHAFIFPVKLGDCSIPRIEIDDTRMMDRLQSIDLYPEKKRAAGAAKLLRSLQDAPGRS